LIILIILGEEYKKENKYRNQNTNKDMRKDAKKQRNCTPTVCRVTQIIALCGTSYWTNVFNSKVKKTSLHSYGLRAGRRRSFPNRGRIFFVIPQRSDRVWALPNPFYNWCQWPFPGVKAAWASNLTMISISCRGEEWWSYTATSPFVFMTWCLLLEA
jgi:hypothetical protein